VRKWTFIRVLAWILGVLGTAFLALVIWYRASVNIEPPRPEDPGRHTQVLEIVDKNAIRSTNGWLRHSSEGMWELYVEGDPFSRGLATGILTQGLIRTQEEAFITEIRRMVPSQNYLKFLRYFVAIFDRNLDEFVPLEYRKEIAGISQYASPDYNFIGDPYLRILNYHAAHDIGHALQNMNLVGCTAFGAWEESSADSSLILGRNFDFYAGDEFSKEKIIMFVRPDSGYAFMSVSWGGFIGVVSGMNEQGLTVTLNAAKSDIPYSAKTPVSILAREILQYASNIEEALQIAKSHRTFVSESFLIGSASDRRAALIEKTPDSTVIYIPHGDYMVVTNHFLSAEFKEDELNRENMANGTSVYRYERTEELIKRNLPLDVTEAVAILRDYKGQKDRDIGLGNEKAVNQFICHHSVIFKPEERKVWVATPPYQLGEYVCYDLDEIFGEGLRCHLSDTLNVSDESIPEDSFLYTSVYHNLTNYKSLSAKLMRDDISANLDAISTIAADSLIKYNPEFFLAYKILGDYYFKINQEEKAADYYRLALDKEAPSEAERIYVMKRLE
jgi:hypothetical protein